MIQYTRATQNCTEQSITDNGGQIILNNDGTVSVYILDNIGKSIPYFLDKKCCTSLGYTFDKDKQECKWSSVSQTTVQDKTFNLALNPNGNDGILFTKEDNETCVLNIEFNFLIKVKCETLTKTLIKDLDSVNVNCDSPVKFLENISLSLNLNILDGENLISVYTTSGTTSELFNKIGTGNLYEYLKTNQNSGLYVCGGDDCQPLNLGLHLPNVNNEYNCNLVLDSILEELYTQSNLSASTNGQKIFRENIPNNALASNWLNYKTTIEDQSIISAITNNKITVTIKLNDFCDSICILLDNIKYEKLCSKLENNKLYITKSPGFSLEKIVDNKKSWVDIKNRKFSISNIQETNTIRNTNYTVDDKRLIINSKEIDLNLNIASAINNDVWFFVSNNPSILSGTGLTTNCCYSACCGDKTFDFNELTNTNLSAITTITEFEYTLSSELIDVKNRKTISSYPTLRALYDRYINSYSYIQKNSLQFDYKKIDAFSNLVGSYWSDIIEQVVPATTIWDSVKLYSNNIFDQQKFKYKSYSLLFCSNPFSGMTVASPINGKNGQYTGVTSTLEDLIQEDNKSLKTKQTVITECSSLYIAQMNYGSEFIGTVSILGQSVGCNGNTNIIGDCNISGKQNYVYTTNTIIELQDLSGYVGQLTYLWSNGDTTSTSSYNTPGNYNVKITDSNCCELIVNFTVV